MAISELKIVSKTQQVKDYLGKNILSGRLKSGDCILSEDKLAKKLGVSTITVRRALSELNNEGLISRIQGKGTFVRHQETRKKYRIGVIVFNSENVYFSKIVRGITDAAKEYGCYLVSGNTERKIDKEKLHLKEIMPEVDGILIAPALDEKGNSPGIESLIAKRFPFCAFSHSPSSLNIKKIHYVVSDNLQGGYLATKHLISLGHQKIVFLTHREDQNNPVFQDRFRGYKKALSEEGIPFRKSFVLATTSYIAQDKYDESGYRVVDKILQMKERPTAVFAINDAVAISLLSVLRGENVKVPGDIAICGFDDIDLAGQWGIELTTIVQPTYRMGRKAVEILIGECKGTIETPQHIVLPVELKVRKTTVSQEKFAEPEPVGMRR